MIAEQLFSSAGLAASFGWLILIFLPRTKWLMFFPKYLIPLGLGLLYGGLMLTHFFVGEGGFGSINDVRTLFENDYILLAGWIHYLAFDLFIGAWIARKADGIGISRLIQAPILMATFQFGPVGLVLFLFIRSVFTQTTQANYVVQNV